MNILLLIFIIFIYKIYLIKCSEFIPVYIWSTNKLTNNVPALQRIDEDFFKRTIYEHFNKNPLIVVFAENTLSPEDLAQTDSNGNNAYTNLNKFIKHSIYMPHVQNPIKSLKELDKNIEEYSLNKLINSKHLNVPEDNIIIVNLNDVRDDESRFNMLKRHDTDITTIFNNLLQHNENILAIYTAYHTSWITPEDIKSHRRRSLLADSNDNDNDNDKKNRKKFVTKDALLYISDTAYLTLNSTKISINNFTESSTTDKDTITMTLSNTNNEIFKFIFKLGKNGYWNLSTTYKGGNDKDEINLQTKSNIFVPIRLSYHCNNTKLIGNDNVTLYLPGFQIQPYFNINNTNTIANISKLKFGDAYDCVNNTSVPIWSGIFVTLLLLIIMTFGLTMMMDIKTMDRFDDAKGKTITVNASE